MFATKLTAMLISAMFLGCGVAAAGETSLKGSKASVQRQYKKAVEHDFTFLKNAKQVENFIKLGLLVKLGGNANYELDDDVTHPAVRPEVKLFVERLARQYRAACGEKLVVTSATRPLTRQPRNASKKSVHPTGMAVDFRVPAGACRKWLEENLRALEERGVAEATRERRPLHYHVTVYPTQYQCYVREKTGKKPCKK